MLSYLHYSSKPDNIEKKLNWHYESEILIEMFDIGLACPISTR